QVAVNGASPGGAPFGGFKLSGLGREGGGIGGIHQYMEPMAIGLPA
ncbi:MAG: aldehyde dehydrogenase, partial [Mycobacterium sp.]|nr:aldehyde dehydrogenase [Mycobacterium sp.]